MSTFEKLPPLQISRSYVYNDSSPLPVELDLYKSNKPRVSNTQIAVVLWLHGGAWGGGNRGDYPAPAFQTLMDKTRAVFICPDFPLALETTIHLQIHHLRLLEVWLRTILPGELREEAADILKMKIIVAGASSGGQLSLLTATYWATPPDSIIVFGPAVNMCELQCPAKFRNLDLEITPSLLKGAISSCPLSGWPVAKTTADFQHPRVKLLRGILKSGLMSSVLLRGVQRKTNDDDGWTLPPAGSVGLPEIEFFCPTALARTRCPKVPTCVVIAEDDDIFDISHMEHFVGILQDAGVLCKTSIVPGAKHAFESDAKSGSKFNEAIMKAFEWAIGVALSG